MTTVLIVDDDPDIRELIAFKLRALGFTIEVAADGEEALAAAFAAPPDLILLDVMMPKMNGLDLTKELRAKSQTEATPIILLTAKAQEADIARGFSLGATDYIVKPFSPRDLVSRVQTVLERAPTAISPIPLTRQ
jgi:DNA-binding response OmpR family regulator